MSEIDQMTLMAFADGQLSEEETRKIRARMESDPALKAEVEQMQALTTALNAAVDSETAGPLPDAIKHALGHTDTVVSLQCRADPPRPVWVAPTAIAASIAAAFMVGVIFGPKPDGGMLPLPVRQALNQAEDGQLLYETKVFQSYLDEGDEFCRSYEQQPEKQVGLACRRNGEWQLRALVAVPQDNAYFPAGGGAESLLSAFTDRLRDLEDGAENAYLRPE